MAGNIVLTVGAHLHDDALYLTEEDKRKLDWLHMQKIKMAHTVIIINKDDYIGESTARELAMARRLGKTIRFEYPHAE